MSIETELNALEQNISDLQDAIVAKGGTVTGDGLATLVQDVGEIPSGGASPDLIINGGTTPPTETTPGTLGALYNYVDTTREQNVPHVMVCLYADPSIPRYRWVEQNSTIVTENNDLTPMNASAGQIWLDQPTGTLQICTKGSTATNACQWESLAKYVNSSKAQIFGRFYSEYELTWSLRSKSGSVSNVTIDNEKFNEYVEANKDKDWEFSGVYVAYYTSDQKFYFGWDNYFKEHGLTLAELAEIGLTVTLDTQANGSFTLDLSIAVSGDFPTLEVFEGLTADDFVGDRPRLFSKTKAYYMDEDTGDEGEDYIFLHSVGELQCMGGDIPDRFLYNNQSNKLSEISIQDCSKIGSSFARNCASEGMYINASGEGDNLEIGSSFCEDSSVDRAYFGNFDSIRVGGYFLAGASYNFGDTGDEFDRFVSVGGGFCTRTTFGQQVAKLNFRSLETIGDRFFMGSNFNFPISLPLVNKIGDNFLQDCTSFNQPLTLCARMIGSSFLCGCTSFNSPVVFSADTIIHPTSFMAGCSAFNQDLTIPHFDQSVGVYSGVMFNCKAMTSKLYISEAPSSMTASNNCLATNDSTAACYTTGIQLVGDYTSDWKTKLPDRTSSPYRKLIVAS